jgi:hypothetical protein
LASRFEADASSPINSVTIDFKLTAERRANSSRTIAFFLRIEIFLTGEINLYAGRIFGAKPHLPFPDAAKRLLQGANFTAPVFAWDFSPNNSATIASSSRLEASVSFVRSSDFFVLAISNYPLPRSSAATTS